MNRAVFYTLLLLILGFGAALRLPQLDRRPMHTDEAVHAVKLEELWRTGRYIYNPEEYHGPTLYYAALPVLWLGGDRSFGDFTESQLRLVTMIFGLGLIALLPLVADGLGRTATIVAAVLTAISTAMAFYSRYYIQEPLLVFFTFLTIAAGWRYVQSRSIGWALLAGLGVGLMHATKETCVIALGCLGLVLLCSVGIERARMSRSVERASSTSELDRPRSDVPRRTLRLDAVAISLALLVAAATSITFYSAFFTNPDGPWDSIRTFANYFDRAGNHGLHDHPWHFYAERLLFYHRAAGPTWTEWLVVALALLGGIAGWRRGPLVRFLALYTLLMTVVYSAIPYKTPWCALGFLHGMILLAGVGVADAIDTLRLGFYPGAQSPPKTAARFMRQVVAALMLLTMLEESVQLTRQTWQSDRRFAADNRNPYVYAHPVGDVLNLAGWIEKLGRVHPDGRRMFIAVLSADAWPVPWYLRRFDRVGYFEDVGRAPVAPVIIVWPDYRGTISDAMTEQYEVNEFGLRPDVRVQVLTWRDLYELFRAREQERASGMPASSSPQTGG